MRFYARFACGNPHFHTSWYKISYDTRAKKRFLDKCDYITRLRLVRQTHTRQITFHRTRSVMYYFFSILTTLRLTFFSTFSIRPSIFFSISTTPFLTFFSTFSIRPSIPSLFHCPTGHECRRLRCQNRINVCGIWFKIGSVARSHWTQVMWRFERSREKRYNHGLWAVGNSLTTWAVSASSVVRKILVRACLHDEAAEHWVPQKSRMLCISCRTLSNSPVLIHRL